YISIEPGSSIDVPVYLSPSAGGAGGTIYVYSTFDGYFFGTIVLDGFGTQESITFNDAAFGYLAVGKTAQQEIYATNNGNVTSLLTRVQLGEGSPMFTFVSNLDPEAGGVTLNPGDQADLGAIVFTPTSETSGYVTGSLTGQYSNNLVNNTLSGTAYQPSGRWNPDTIDFGDVGVDEDPGYAQAKFVNDDDSGGDVVLTGLSIGGANGDDFAIQTSNGQEFPVTVPSGQKFYFDVFAFPSAVGARSAVVTVQLDAGEAGTLTLKANGIGGAISTSDTAAFGDVRVGTTSTRTIHFTNTGDGFSAITNVTLSGAGAGRFSNTDPTTSELDPGTVSSVDVTYAPTAIASDAATLTITFDTAASLVIPLTGAGIGPDFAITPGSIDFGTQLVGQKSQSVAVLVKNQGLAPGHITAAALSGDNAADFALLSVDLTSAITVGAGRTQLFALGFAPANAGVRTAKLTITAETATDTSTLEVTLTGQANTPPVADTPRISVSPTSLDFGPVGVGASLTKTLTVTNSGTVPADVIVPSVADAPAGFSVSISGATTSTLAVGGTLTLAVVFAPAAGGAQAQTLNLAPSGGAGIAVPLTGTGVAPGLTGPTKVDFGQVTIGGAGSKTIVLTNPGTQPVQLVSYSSDTATFSLHGPALPATIAAGATLNLTALFTPAVTGAGTATASFKVQGGADPTLTIPLAGTGVALKSSGCNTGPAGLFALLGVCVLLTRRRRAAQG
ncbi:MAG: choice-of-anchor D domain-containing protein, partial [Deltaproteobacteria bacterium]|nr:choice-of-anchor D domain-containing protein [Deltaproteobacteria bacterium]